ncbi:hypothetical protein TSUD_194430 [Trifolium subterraneum]|uniref:Uncharacterized protein n=1 Tax=Trifolium subterraneum TaxID=3900 RepID=A0A2Z6PDZ8_TRISU|nr:hypothetical protein TSUD_194430 [Trifolium subterraneum]
MQSIQTNTKELTPKCGLNDLAPKLCDILTIPNGMHYKVWDAVSSRTEIVSSQVACLYFFIP